MWVCCVLVGLGRWVGPRTWAVWRHDLGVQLLCKTRCGCGVPVSVLLGMFMCVCSSYALGPVGSAGGEVLTPSLHRDYEIMHILDITLYAQQHIIMLLSCADVSRLEQTCRYYVGLCNEMDYWQVWRHHFTHTRQGPTTTCQQKLHTL